MFLWGLYIMKCMNDRKSDKKVGEGGGVQIIQYMPKFAAYTCTCIVVIYCIEREKTLCFFPDIWKSIYKMNSNV